MILCAFSNSWLFIFFLFSCTILFVVVTIILAMRQQSKTVDTDIPDQKDISVAFETPSVYSRVVSCFDVAANFESIFADNPGKGLTAVDGIK